MSTDTPKNLYAVERYNLILDIADAQGRVEVSALADRLGVTPETIRRDLRTLESRGRLRRVHGGALPISDDAREPSTLERLGRQRDEKQRIAHAALAEVPVEGTILLDAGTSTLALAAALPTDQELVVVTNSPAIASALQDKTATVYLLGGQLRGRTGAAVGVWAQQALADVRVDVAFMGANGFTVGWGFSTPDQAEADTKQAMVRAAKRVVVLADSSKAGRTHFHRFATIDDVDLLITDTALDAETAEELEQTGLEVLRS